MRFLRGLSLALRMHDQFQGLFWPPINPDFFWIFFGFFPLIFPLTPAKFLEKLTPPTKKKTFFSISVRIGIGVTIRTHKEFQCLPICGIVSFLFPFVWKAQSQSIRVIVKQNKNQKNKKGWHSTDLWPHPLVYIHIFIYKYIFFLPSFCRKNKFFLKKSGQQN